MPAWVGCTAENNRKNNANGQARNAKAACPFIFERFRKKNPGTSPGHDGAARLGTLDSHRKNTEKIQSVIKRSNIPPKDANGGPFGLIPQKEATPQKPRWPGTKTALRGRPGARRSAAGGCFSLRRASIWCILYSVLVWAAAGTRGRPARPEPEAAKAWRTRETIPEGRLV